jgi:SAM-dependent methyltransferase
VSTDRDQLRQTFNTDAELYDRARPSYPVRVVQDLARLAGIGPGSRVLEIGPGTGQLTVPLAGLGCAITAVELGPELAAVARRKLGGFTDADVVVAAYEDWPLPAEPFDAVVSATAFHWLNPRIRVPKTAAALRPGGALAILHAHHVAGGTAGFLADSQACYERWDPDTPPGGIPIPDAAETIGRERRLAGAEMAESGLFTPATFSHYETEVAYSATAWMDTLRTYSSTIAMDAETREGLLRCLAGLINARYRGRITKRYLFGLTVARRIAGSR